MKTLISAVAAAFMAFSAFAETNSVIYVDSVGTNLTNTVLFAVENITDAQKHMGWRVEEQMIIEKRQRFFHIPVQGIPKDRKAKKKELPPPPTHCEPEGYPFGWL